MHTETIDTAAYTEKIQSDNAIGRCFICELADERTTPEHFAAVDKAEYLAVPKAELDGLAQRIGAAMTALAE